MIDKNMIDEENPIGLLLVEDQDIMRKGLHSLIGDRDDMVVVGEASDGITAIDKAETLEPDVVLMDVALPKMNGIKATRGIKETSSDTKVVGLSVHSDRNYVAEMLKSGASGYLIKECAFDELVEAIHTVMEDRMYLSEMIFKAIAMEFNNLFLMPEVDSARLLTEEERHIIDLIRNGKTTSQIRGELDCHGRRFDRDIQNIVSKWILLT
jgi:DNA-binding NarL/FixJ family response regulator